MENGQKTISDLFESRRIFNIPKYQRAYSWGEKQLQDFIKDLENQTLDRDYFFGTLLLNVRESEGHFKIIDVVDGQQRITTLVIFMRVLLQKLAEAGDDVEILRETYSEYRGEYRLRTLEYDDAFFKRHIMAENPDGSPAPETPSQRRMIEAKKFFDAAISGVPTDTAREFRAKIERAKVLTYSVSNNAEATLIFETTNDRGKPLTSLEKIKSFLMYKVYVTSRQPEEQLYAIQERFGEIYKDYETMREKWIVDEDDILRNHYITFVAGEKEARREDYSKHLWLLKDKINALAADENTKEAAAQYIEKYSIELRETFSTFRVMSGMFYGDLLNLHHLRKYYNFIPLLIVALKFDKKHSKTDFERVTRLLEILRFRVYGVRKRKTNNGTMINRIFSTAQRFEGDYEKLCDTLKDLISEFCSDHDFRKRLESPKLYEDLSSNDLTYLLWRYENHVRQSDFTDQPQLQYRNKYRSFSIEHIAPQSTTYYPFWVGNGFEDTHLHSLGNLTLDFSVENSSKSNLPFGIKYSFFYKESTFKSQQEIIKFVDSEAEEWDEKSVEKRLDKVLQFALNCWDHKVV